MAVLYRCKGSVKVNSSHSFSLGFCRYLIAVCFLNLLMNTPFTFMGLGKREWTGLLTTGCFQNILYIYIYIYFLNSYTTLNLFACNKLLLNAGHKNGCTFWPEQLFSPRANLLFIITGYEKKETKHLAHCENC